MIRVAILSGSNLEIYNYGNINNKISIDIKENDVVNMDRLVKTVVKGSFKINNDKIIPVGKLEICKPIIDRKFKDAIYPSIQFASRIFDAVLIDDCRIMTFSQFTGKTIGFIEIPVEATDEDIYYEVEKFKNIFGIEPSKRFIAATDKYTIIFSEKDKNTLEVTRVEVNNPEYIKAAIQDAVSKVSKNVYVPKFFMGEEI